MTDIMSSGMTVSTQGDQILLYVVTQMTSGVDVVDLEFSRASAVLTSPLIPLQHAPMKLLVLGWSESHARLL